MVLFYAKNHPEMIPKSNVFSSIVSQKVAAHSFLPPGYPGGIEGYFSPKTSTFSDHRIGGDKMAVFRIEKTRDYTVMSNHHLRNAGLSLKSKGLLSMILFLPED